MFPLVSPSSIHAQNQKMLHSRALFSGPVRPSNGFLDDDHKEAYISVKSLKVEEKAF
jgi:hypothetical protein